MLIKKPKTYDQQIAILKNKNIAIIDDVSAKTFLKQVNYYRFSGYFLPFQVNGHGHYFPILHLKDFRQYMNLMSNYEIL